MSRISGKNIHVVSFDIPYPANYGGVIDVYFKLLALKELGHRIHLHCWQYGDRAQHNALDAICEQVFYYPRKMWVSPIGGNLPYIVKSRKSEKLLERLVKFKYPILFEGIHTTGFLNHDLLKDRTRVVRNHNIESDYYLHLAKKEKHPLKKLYFKSETKLLKEYEKQLKTATAVASISEKDHNKLNRIYGNSHYIPVFHSNPTIKDVVNQEDYCLYHGNLAVQENNEAAINLIDEVFSQNNFRFVIAGNKASKPLKEKIGQFSNIELQENITTEAINALIQKAKVNVLATFQATGIKLKLLAVLFLGGHVLVNQKMVEGTGLESCCDVASLNNMNHIVARMMHNKVDDRILAMRKQLLAENFNNLKSAQHLSNLLFK